MKIKELIKQAELGLLEGLISTALGWRNTVIFFTLVSEHMLLFWIGLWLILFSSLPPDAHPLLKALPYLLILTGPIGAFIKLKRLAKNPVRDSSER